MNSYFKPAAMLLVLFTFLTGAAYPALVTLLAQTLFNDQANGSLIKDAQGQVIGSALIGQHFSEPKYFWSRPSATAPFAYNAAASSGSNLGPTNPVLIEAISTRIQALKHADPGNQTPIPVDLVTASGSGLDPHISIAAAEYQIKRIGNARKISEEELHELVNRYREDRQWLVFGEPRINVVKLNLVLDEYRANHP